MENVDISSGISSNHEGHLHDGRMIDLSTRR
ncbi:hypothetical protein NPIL_26231, partial [Nephila pilipes]